MSLIHERLHKAIDQQRRLVPKRRPGPNDIGAEAAFRPVREAAAELRDELSHVPDLNLEIAPDGVWIELYDKHLWFSYDANERVFIGTEQDTKWMEGGLREALYRWDTADACIEAMIQACARYVSLAEAISKLRSGQ
jgi:hypothetical protein